MSQNNELNNPSIPRYNGPNEIRIRGVRQDIITQLRNISDHLGVTVNDMLKPKLREIIDSYPEHYKKPFNK